jgi:anaerobic magnesium-protoporphyrin IX monomethyl ester cyclase
LMWGYEGEEIEDIAATVEHVKECGPDVFFTTVSYPIKGTGYFDSVHDKLDMPIAWEDGSDRDYAIRGRHDRVYYGFADQWLRDEVEADKIAAGDPQRAAELIKSAQAARLAMQARKPA